ncbi:hypothetical protein J3459_014937 [Metarhizium acridum]|nr:hypothetical protein J3459_014937 [Metarhizium acridum]
MANSSGIFTVKEIDRAKNNHVYLICLAQTTTELLLSKDSFHKPFTSAIPANTSRLVLRVPKSNVSLENSVRVRNEVAFLALARHALSSLDASLCPRIFDWEDMNSNNLGSGSRLGWILEEWKAGRVLEQGHVEGLDNETQQYVLDQISQVTKLLYEYYCPPENATGFGGLTFDEHGNMSNTATTIP